MTRFIVALSCLALVLGSSLGKTDFKNSKSSTIGITVIYESAAGTCSDPKYDGGISNLVLKPGETGTVDAQGGAACWLWVPESEAPVSWKQKNWCTLKEGDIEITDKQGSQCRGIKP